MLAQRLESEPLGPRTRVLDLCTGSGLLAVLAARRGAREVVAVDISRLAVVAARLNGSFNGVKVHGVQGDLFSAVRGERFDLIVSNPPYLPSETDALPRRGRSRAWEAGRQGRALIDRICAEVSGHLNPDGVLLLVHSSVCGEGETVRALSERGLNTSVVARHRGPLGPRLRARAQWLRSEGLLPDAGIEELVVVRAQAPHDEAAVRRGRAALTANAESS
jgi:release factor glutamine methyltransferase